ncbi:MAG: type II toxin-antitoxin system RelE/ParE family toxin [Thermodesulfobacteriota bacterium]
MQIEELYRRKRPEGFTIYGIMNKGKSPAKEYLDSLDDKNRVQMTALIDRINEHGLPFNTKRFRPLGEGVFELKARSGSRIFCFQGSQNSLILTHGFNKPKPRRLEIEKQKALKWYKEYQNL